MLKVQKSSCSAVPVDLVLSYHLPWVSNKIPGGADRISDPSTAEGPNHLMHQLEQPQVVGRFIPPRYVCQMVPVNDGDDDDGDDDVYECHWPGGIPFTRLS